MVSIGDKMAFLCQLGITGLVIVVMSASQARGQAIDRGEIMVEIIGNFVSEFAFIFLGINEIADAKERKREYIRRCDEMLRQVYPAARVGNIKLIKDSES